jgi:hypothetical protein
MTYSPVAGSTWKLADALSMGTGRDVTAGDGRM